MIPETVVKNDDRTKNDEIESSCIDEETGSQRKSTLEVNSPIDLVFSSVSKNLCPGVEGNGARPRRKLRRSLYTDRQPYRPQFRVEWAYFSLPNTVYATASGSIKLG